MPREIVESVVYVDGVATVTGRRYATLREELTKKFGTEFRQMVLTSLGGTLPTDIDDFEARFNPLEVAHQFALTSGITEAQWTAVPIPLKVMFRLFLRVALMAIIFDHGKIPSMSQEAMDREDPVP